MCVCLVEQKLATTGDNARQCATHRRTQPAAVAEADADNVDAPAAGLSGVRGDQPTSRKWPTK